MTRPTGDHPLVALRTPPGQPLVDAIRTAWGRGEAVLPIPDRWPDSLLAEVLTTLRPHVLVDGTTRTVLDDPSPLPAGVTVVVATSGASGTPKGVELTRDALHHAAASGLRRIGATDDDRWLLCVPAHHIAGLLVLVRSELLGGDPVVHDRFDLERVAEATGVTLVSLVPTMLRRLLEAGADLSRFRRILLGGADPSPHLLERARDAGATVTLTYGATETCGGCVYDGAPLEGVQVRLDGWDGSERDRSDGIGRIAIAGPVLMRGYRNQPGRTSRALQDGWFRTRDLGRFTPEGRLEVLGRADDIIVSGGVNVPAAAVARILREHPRVADAAVTAAAHDDWGQIVVAHVVPTDAAAPPTLDQLRRFVADRADPHHAPRALQLTDAIPRTELGKLRRGALRPPDSAP